MMSPQLPLLLLVLASSRPVRAAGPAAWRDSAIGASELVVLDGSDWHVSGAGRTLSSHCMHGRRPWHCRCRRQRLRGVRGWCQLHGACGWDARLVQRAVPRDGR
jgi:hypothetical protein